MALTQSHLPSFPLSPPKTTNKLFHMVKAKNDKGTHLPLWGTCMGFQLLHILAADDEGVLELEAFDSEVGHNCGDGSAGQG